jgi:hypothetical protein
MLKLLFVAPVRLGVRLRGHYWSVHRLLKLVVVTAPVRLRASERLRFLPHALRSPRMASVHRRNVLIIHPPAGW